MKEMSQDSKYSSNERTAKRLARRRVREYMVVEGRKVSFFFLVAAYVIGFAERCRNSPKFPEMHINYVIIIRPSWCRIARTSTTMKIWALIPFLFEFLILRVCPNCLYSACFTDTFLSLSVFNKDHCYTLGINSSLHFV